MLRASDRAIRRLVVRLAGLQPDDLTAVLNELEPAQRATVEMLLSDYLTKQGVPRADPYVSHLSPWLTERIAGTQGSMTDHARTALQACAARLFPSPPSTIDARSPSLLGRVASLVTPR